ncbi:unnamed protein product [Psylliodes chrysocephalus]|uniref:Uncharacterized protein n=1 Tax=Psylliodes chrysocephalus TaxID=3402493 RepID=A0A9P0GI35_9CUCU|nr:unnamed protein product [Psylliodes chrysocephala]
MIKLISWEPGNANKLTDAELAYYLENDADDIGSARETDTYYIESEDFEKEILHESELDSDSEQSVDQNVEKSDDENMVDSDDENMVDSDDENMNDQDFFLGRDKQTKLYTNPIIPKFSKIGTQNIIKILPGLIHIARSS